jgi:aspartate/methionine/tyrosine aminotransferase
MAFSGRYSARTERLGGDVSGVWAVHERASALLAAGEEVYLLSVGDPDLPTLPSTIDHAIESLRVPASDICGRWLLGSRNGLPTARATPMTSSSFRAPPMRSTA